MEYLLFREGSSLANVSPTLHELPARKDDRKARAYYLS